MFFPKCSLSPGGWQQLDVATPAVNVLLVLYLVLHQKRRGEEGAIGVLL